MIRRTDARRQLANGLQLKSRIPVRRFHGLHFPFGRSRHCRLKQRIAACDDASRAIGLRIRELELFHFLAIRFRRLLSAVWTIVLGYERERGERGNRGRVLRWPFRDIRFGRATNSSLQVVIRLDFISLVLGKEHNRMLLAGDIRLVGRCLTGGCVGIVNRLKSFRSRPKGAWARRDLHIIDLEKVSGTIPDRILMRLRKPCWGVFHDELGRSVRPNSMLWHWQILTKRIQRSRVDLALRFIHQVMIKRISR